MSRVLPYPILSAALLALWLLLNESLSPGQILLGSVVAVGAGKAMGALRPEKVRLRRPDLILKLLGVVLVDVVRSNLAVARIIVARPRSGGASGFMRVRLDLRDRMGLAVLAVILTATPGTIFLEYDPETGDLLLHVLDLVDEAHWVDIIKNRYERLLLEIFA